MEQRTAIMINKEHSQIIFTKNLSTQVCKNA